MCVWLRWARAEREVSAQVKAPCKRKLQRTVSAIPSPICLCRTEVLKLDCTLKSPREVFKFPNLIGGVEASISIFPRSPGDSHVEPGLQTTNTNARWPQIRYVGKEGLTLGGHKSVSSPQAWLAIPIPLRPFIKIHTPKH